MKLKFIYERMFKLIVMYLYTVIQEYKTALFLI